MRPFRASSVPNLQREIVTKTITALEAVGTTWHTGPLPGPLLIELCEANAELSLVGGWAVILHGLGPVLTAAVRAAVPDRTSLRRGMSR